MKYGCCLNMVSGRPDGTGTEHLFELAEAGFDYVELPFAETMKVDESAFEAIRSALARSGISCPVCNNFFPKTMRLTGADADPAETTLEYVRRCLPKAKSLGVRKVIFGSGGAKRVPDGFPMEKGYEQVVGLCKKIGPVARDNGIVIAIEPLRKQECNIINTFEEGCRLARDTGDPNVRVLVDYYHLSVEAEPADHVRKLGPAYLEHIHFANPAGRIYPRLGDGQDYSAFISAVKDSGYDDTISCEAYSKDFPADARAALAFFRSNFG